MRLPASSPGVGTSRAPSRDAMQDPPGGERLLAADELPGSQRGPPGPAKGCLHHRWLSAVAPTVAARLAAGWHRNRSAFPALPTAALRSGGSAAPVEPLCGAETAARGRTDRGRHPQPERTVPGVEADSGDDTLLQRSLLAELARLGGSTAEAARALMRCRASASAPGTAGSDGDGLQAPGDRQPLRRAARPLHRDERRVPLAPGSDGWLTVASAARPGERTAGRCARR